MNAFNALADGNTATNSSNVARPPINDPDAIVCTICQLGDKEKTLLLCDGCNQAMHTGCLNMRMIPPGDWYCPRCKRNGCATTGKAPRKGDYVYLYERVSSKGQNDPEHGRVGIDTQNYLLQKYCFERNIIIRATFTDVGSGRNVDKLREFKDMVSRMPKGTCVMIYSVSRFGRNLEQVQGYLNALHERSCYVYSVSDGLSSFEDRFLELVEQAQQESAALSRTIRESINRRRQEGHWIGPAPYGFEAYRDQNNIRKIRVLQDFVPMADTFQANNADTIMKWLEVNQVPAKTGEWTPAKVRALKKRIQQAATFLTT